MGALEAVLTKEHNIKIVPPQLILPWIIYFFILFYFMRLLKLQITSPEPFPTLVKNGELRNYNFEKKNFNQLINYPVTIQISNFLIHQKY